MIHPGSIVYVEIPVRDLERAADFYTGLFGWQFEEDDNDPQRWVFTPAGQGAMGAITTARPTGPGGAKLTITVDSVRRTVELAIKLGGGPKELSVTDVGERVELVDPDGNHLWAFQSRLSRMQFPTQQEEKA